MVEAARDSLKQLVLGGRCVAFLGAGISYPVGKKWKELVEEIAKRCGTVVEHSLPETIDRCIESNLEMCNAAMRDLLPRANSVVRNAITQVMRLPFSAIITTNFDPWIHGQSRTSDFSRSHVYPDLPLREGLRNGIYYVHGYFDSERRDACVRKLVFGKRSFDQAYYGDSLLQGFLLQVFSYENVLFVGIDPLEPHLSEILQKSMAIQRTFQSQSRPLRFITLAREGGADGEDLVRQDVRVEKMRALGIETIQFGRSDGGWSGVDRMLEEWVREGELKNRPAPFKSGSDLGSEKLGARAR